MNNFYFINKNCFSVFILLIIILGCNPSVENRTDSVSNSYLEDSISQWNANFLDDSLDKSVRLHYDQKTINTVQNSILDSIQIDRLLKLSYDLLDFETDSLFKVDDNTLIDYGLNQPDST